MTDGKLAQEQVIDLTGPGDSPRCVEVLTPGGMVRVNAGLTDARTGQPEVVVEVEPNTAYWRRTETGGDWHAGVLQLGRRVDVTLTREAEGDA